MAIRYDPEMTRTSLSSSISIKRYNRPLYEHEAIFLHQIGFVMNCDKHYRFCEAFPTVFPHSYFPEINLADKVMYATHDDSLLPRCRCLARVLPRGTVEDILIGYRQVFTRCFTRICVSLYDMLELHRAKPCCLTRISIIAYMYLANRVSQIFIIVGEDCGD
jgi:hypothetical protein